MKKRQKARIVTSAGDKHGHSFRKGTFVEYTGENIDDLLFKFKNRNGKEQWLDKRDFVLINDAETQSSVTFDGK